MEQTTETQAAEITLEPKRPTFLTVVCILSFIGIGIILLLSLANMKESFMTTDEMMTEMSARMEELAEVSPEMAEKFMSNADGVIETHKYAKINWIVGFIGNLLSLVGCILMWRLHKKGFYLYCIAEIVPFALSLFLWGGAKAMTAAFSMFGGDGLGTAMIGLIIFFDILFIVFYTLNLKAMK